MRRIPPTHDELAALAPFDTLSPSARALLAPHTDRLALRAGTTLAREGRLAREVVVVLAGEVEARRAGAPAASVGPGAVIGAGGVVAGSTHGATWTAVSDVDVVVVNGPAFRAAVADALHPAA